MDRLNALLSVHHKEPSRIFFRELKVGGPDFPMEGDVFILESVRLGAASEFSPEPHFSRAIDEKREVRGDAFGDEPVERSDDAEVRAPAVALIGVSRISESVAQDDPPRRTGPA